MLTPLPKYRPFFVQWLLLGSFLLFLTGFVALGSYFEYQRIEATEREQLLNQTKVIDQNMVRQLDSINRALTGIRGDAVRRGNLQDGKVHTTRHLKALVDAMPGLRTLLITDAQGTITSSNRDNLVGQNFKGRDYFKAPLQNPSPDTLYISPPFTTSLGVYSMSVTKAIVDYRGDFAGVISATLAPDHFEVLMDSVRYTPEMWVSLGHGAGTVFMMVPEREAMAGKRLALPGTFFTRHAESKQIASVFSGTVYATGEDRMIAVRTVQSDSLHMDQSLVIAVSRDLPAIFAAWRGDAYVQVALLGTVMWISIFGLAFYQRRQRIYLDERERIEKQLRDAGEELERFFTLSLDLLCIADMQGNFLRLNRSWESTLGYSLAELEGSSYLDYVHPDDVAATLAAMADLESNKSEVIGFTNRYRCKDGSYKWIEWHSKPFQETLVYAVARDITQRKESEEREAVARNHAEELSLTIARSELFLKALADHLPGMVGYWDQDLHCRFANISYLEWFGKRPEEMLGISMQELMGECLFALNEPYVRKVLAGENQHFERTLTKADGSTGYTWANYIPDIADDGSVAGFFVLVTDVTPLKIAEKEKDDMWRNQRALINAIQETTFLMDKDSTVLVINDIGAQRLNTTPEELVGTRLLDHFPPDVSASRRVKFDEVALKGKPEFFEDERPGHRFFNAIYPITDEHGVVQRFAVYAAEITRQHRQKLIDDILSAINQQILQGMPLHQVLEDICQKVAAAFQLEAVWLGRKESDGAISVLATAGSATHYVDQLKITGVRWDDTPLGRGPAGSAIRFGQSQIFNVADPRFRAWSTNALENGLQSIFAIPLVIRSEIYGVFALYSSDPAVFESPELVDQLKSVGRRICIALESGMDQQQVRLLSSALESAANGVLITDPQGRIRWSNPAFSKLCGYSREELLGQTPRILKSGQQSLDYYRVLWETIGKGEIWSSETVERAKDGTTYTVSQTITPIFTDGELTHFIAIHEDISAQKITQARIQHMAHYDSLTGLPNRPLFYDRLRQSLSMAKRNNSGLALLYMDLDGFKKVNDSMGHHAGDLLLMEVAERLIKCTRESDTIARLGGDEFTIILNEAHKLEDATAVAQKIIESISAPFDLDGLQAEIGISIGISRYSEDVSNEDELMRRADEAMYEAKAAGKNTYCIGRPE